MLELGTPTPIINPDLDEDNPIPPVGHDHHISPCHELAVACRRTSLSSDTMASRRVPLEITYRKPGIEPPVALAGTFSETPWKAEDMEASIDERGEYTFTKQIWVNEGSQVQYKFRVGSQGLWTLDEDAEKVADVSGNTNNIAKAGTRAPGRQLLKPYNVSHLQTQDRAGSSTPIEQVADTAAEVADTAEDLDCESEPDDYGGPMLAHEDLCLCDERKSTDKMDVEAAHTGDGSFLGVHQYDREPNVDPNDPNIEHFPHDRAGVFATIRRLSTTVDPDDLVFENMPHQSPISPRFPIPESQFKESASSGFAPEEGSGIRQDGEQIGHFTRPRSASLSANSVGAASLSSLGAIAEDDEVTDAQEDKNGPLMDGMAPVIQHSGPASGRSQKLDLADVDEGIAMGSAVAPWRESPSPREKNPELLSPRSAGSNGSGVVDKHDPAPNPSPPVKEDEVVTACDGEHYARDAPDLTAARMMISSPPLQSPRIVVHDADESEYFFSTKHPQRGTSYGATSETNSLRDSRPASTVERPGTSTSMRSIQETGARPRREGWLHAFCRIVFVELIGGILAKLFNWRRAS